MNADLGNPFENVTQVETAQELLDIAFSKSMDSRPPSGRGSAVERSRNHELNRINTAANVLVDRIERIINQFPSIDNIHPFYQEMCDLLFGIDKLKISLGRVHGVVDHIRNIQQEVSLDLATTYIKEENKQARRRSFGRFSSIIQRISKHLDALYEAREKLNSLPSFNPILPTVVITGVPNAGKSSFINKYTSGKPEVASYPFTTKKVIFGHRKLDFLTIQFVDTPGLLDRSFSERNDIELQAILALRYLSDIMIYFIDPTADASCSLDEQIHLLKEIEEFYTSFSFIVAVTKIDIVPQDTLDLIKDQVTKSMNDKIELFYISSTEDTGIDELFKHLESKIKNDVLKSRKFRYLTTPQIADDQITAEFEESDDDDIWY